MGDAQGLVSRIVALRKRLDAMQPPLRRSTASDEKSESTANPEMAHVEHLQLHIESGRQETVLLDAAVRQLESGLITEEPVLPARLIARTRRLLEAGQHLLVRLRGLDLVLEGFSGRREHWDQQYREILAMAETVIRLIQLLPDSAHAQSRICEGLEPIVESVAHRLTELETAVGKRQLEQDRVAKLSEYLLQLRSGQGLDVHRLAALAEDLYREAEAGEAIRFLCPIPGDPGQFVAAQALTTAQVIARLVRLDAVCRRNPIEPIIAALVKDVGMLEISPALFEGTERPDDEQRREIELHTVRGSDLLLKRLPKYPWLADAAGCHHERLNGTGYPSGLCEPHLSSVARMLAVADVYAAMCSARPYRAAFDPRTALAETLLLAEGGFLDRQWAEKLLQLSFYPIGTIVELADGAVGVVVASPQPRRDLQAPARPVLALLADPRGHLLPRPQHVDLSQCESRSIVRTLSEAERLTRLGNRYPELV